jgi:hypothetical protein
MFFFFFYFGNKDKNSSNVYDHRNLDFKLQILSPSILGEELLIKKRLNQ